jgi:tetratricopeptide (TPR) repeat protein
VDADPYRDAVRDAVLADDQAKVVELAGQPAALEQPPGFTAFLAESGAISAGRLRQLLETAVRRQPGDLRLLMTLGNSYTGNQEAGANERLRWYQAAVAAAPTNPAAHSNLGIALQGKGQVEEAIACYRKAITLDPKLAAAHYNLGLALYGKGQLDEAIASYQKVLTLDPKAAKAQIGLGGALRAKGQVDEAIACYHQALALDPKDAFAHYNLGVALAGKGQRDEAIACYQKAVALDSKNPYAHYNLGVALQTKGRLDEAIACYQKALTLDPKHAEAHCNLGQALALQGRFTESLAALKRGHELGSKQLGWRYPSAAWVRQAEVKATLEAQLPALRTGAFQPRDNPERLALARVCQAKKLHHAATGLYAAAFADDPKLADDLGAQHRYNAACFAALAAAGQGEDAAHLDDPERARLRKQAFDWLRADLALYMKQLQTGKPADRATVQQRMKHWQKDTDLAGLRDPAALAKLPVEEQQACAQVWADVAALLKKVEAPAKEEGKP